MKKGISLSVVLIGAWILWESRKPNHLANPIMPIYGPPMPVRTWKEWAFDYGRIYSLDPFLLLAIMRKESGFNPSIVSKPNKDGTRDYGLMQINETNFEALGLDAIKVFDIGVNLDAACKLLVSKQEYIRKHLGSVTLPQLISAYNQGEGNLVKRGITNWGYVSFVLAFRAIFKLTGGPKYVAA